MTDPERPWRPSDPVTGSVDDWLDEHVPGWRHEDGPDAAWLSGAEATRTVVAARVCEVMDTPAPDGSDPVARAYWHGWRAAVAAAAGVVENTPLPSPWA